MHILAAPEGAGGNRPASYGNATLAELERVSLSASACSRHWTATAGFVVTQDFFTYCLAAKVDG